MRKKIIAFLMATVLTTLIVGCGEKKQSEETKGDNNSSSNVTTESDKPVTLDNLPEGERITLTWWVVMNESTAKKVKSYNEMPWVAELEDAMNVDIEFIHPSIGKEREQFNLLISSGKYPDIIQTKKEDYYQGGPTKAIADGVYLDLTDLIDEYAPDYKEVLYSDNEITKLATTSDGEVWGIKQLQTKDETSWQGPMIRKDLLDRFNLEIPTTIDEWDHVLTTFKDNGVKVPLQFEAIGEDYAEKSGVFVGAFGVHHKFYQDNGTVKFGPVEEGYKEYLTLMNRWYKNGILDPDFATRDRKGMDSIISSGDAGATINNSGRIIKYEAAGKKLVPDFELAAVPYPSLKEGEKAQFKQTNDRVKDHGAAISTSCKYPELALQVLNYGYTDEGFLLYNYGGNEKYYTIDENGKPQHSEYAVENYNDLKYYYKVHSGPYYRDQEAHVNPGVDAVYINERRELWDASAGEDIVIPKIKMTLEETSEYAAIMAEVNTYVEEMSLKFIIGAKSLDEFEGFVKQIKKMDIDKAIEVQQAALDRFYQ